MAERYVRNVEARGSNPLTSTAKTLTLVVDVQLPTVERHMNRPCIPEGVIEYMHIKTVDGTVDGQVVEIGELTGHSN